MLFGQSETEMRVLEGAMQELDWAPEIPRLMSRQVEDAVRKECLMWALNASLCYKLTVCLQEKLDSTQRGQQVAEMSRKQAEASERSSGPLDWELEQADRMMRVPG